MNKWIIALAVSSLIFIGFDVKAQEGEGGNEDTYLGIGSGARRITRTQKESIRPLHVDSTLQMEEIKYYLEPKQKQVNYHIENITPARLKIVEPLEKLHSGYAKAGVGSYLTPLMEVYYGSKRSKYESWGVVGKAQSAFSDIKGMGNTRYSDALIGAYFQKFFLYNDLWMELDYHRNNYRFYGLNYLDSSNNELFDADSLFGQHYNFFDAHVKFNSRNVGRDTNKLRYRTWLDVHHLNSNYQLNENHVLIGAHSGWLILSEEFLGTLEIDINNLSQPEMFLDSNEIIQVADNNNHTSAIVRFNPHIYTRKNNLMAKLGVSIQADINDVAKFHFFPDVEVSYSLFNNVFIPYGGLKGNVQRNTFNSVRMENPFASEDLLLRNTTQKLNLYAGIRGSLSSAFTFNISTYLEKFNDFYFYIPDTISSHENKFQLMYHNLNRSRFLAEITYQKAEKLKIAAKGEYFIYSLPEADEEERAWQRPDFKFTLSSVLDLSDKIIIKGDLFLIGSRNVYSYYEPNEELDFNLIGGRYIYKLKPFIDMNIMAEYRYNKRVSAFIQFNNFTAKKYQFWTNYPVQSINILGGVTFSF